MDSNDFQQLGNASDSAAAIESTEVIICGCGPTGAILSALLSSLEVENICLEKEADIVKDPRGIALDEDGIRALQAAGVLDAVYSEIGQCVDMLNFIGGVHSDLHRAPFMRRDFSASESKTGHVGLICHKQPTLEMHLRKRIEESKYSMLKPSCTLLSIEEDPEWVTVTYADSGGIERKLRGRFLVGADGKTGYTRKKYLETKGVVMEQISETSYAETWVAMNLRLTLPTPETHPDFPLWKLGYTPTQVYDLFFPKDFRFLCNPNRPAVCGRFGLPKDRMWRFEYVVSDGEDPVEMSSYDSVRKIVFPYLTHSAHRYVGLSHDVAFPEDCIEVLRCRPFWFSARSCNMWALGRVLLCGDSAHVFPPYGGQGIVSGFRDAMALAWRLKVGLSSPAAHGQLFQAWYLERKQQLERSLATTVENGRHVTERNAFRIMMRDAYLALLQLIPSWKRWLEQGGGGEGMCTYTHRPGLHFAPHSGGKLLPQVYCRSLTTEDSPVQFTDDVIFAREKSGLFQILVVVHSRRQGDEVRQQHRSIDLLALSSGFVKPSEETILVHNLDATSENAAADEKAQVVRIASAEEFAASPLCLHRPAPKNYDPNRISKEFPGKRYIVLRPDRFTFSACADIDELCASLKSISPTLGDQQTVP